MFFGKVERPLSVLLLLTPYTRWTTSFLIRPTRIGETLPSSQNLYLVCWRRISNLEAFQEAVLELRASEIFHCCCSLPLVDNSPYPTVLAVKTVPDGIFDFWNLLLKVQYITSNFYQRYSALFPIFWVFTFTTTTNNNNNTNNTKESAKFLCNFISQELLAGFCSFKEQSFEQISDLFIGVYKFCWIVLGIELL